MKFIRKINWQDPENIFLQLEKKFQYIAFLYSSAKYSYSGDYSYIVWEKIGEEISDINNLKEKLGSGGDFYDNFWVGYLGYESFFGQKDYDFKAIKYKKACFFKPKNILEFNHIKKEISFYSDCNRQSLDEEILRKKTKITKSDKVAHIVDIKSNMTKSSYLDKLLKIKKEIKEGNFYQANLTRKFYGTVKDYDAGKIFVKLSKISPSPYSCYIKIKDLKIISSSPERFININKKGEINARPIKGTQDKKNKNDMGIELSQSSKDKSENLMITDLLRHDIGISSEYNTVKVDKLFEIDSFSTVNHMSSSIWGQKKKNLKSIDVVEKAFPPGSMTGAPKKASIEFLKREEKDNRGIYSGCIGYFSGKDICDLSVVIRTIIIQKDKYEFQVGGGIIYDSVPELEYQETLIKAKAILKTLDIKKTQIEGL